MSNEKLVPLVKEDLVAELSEINYQNLKKHFDSIGLPQGTFETGKKKAELIEKAVDILIDIRNQAILDQESAEELDVDFSEVVADDQVEPQNVQPEVEKKPLSWYEDQLKRIDVNLSQATGEMKALLMKRRVIIQNEIDNY